MDFSKLPPPSPSPRFGQLVPLYLSTKNVNLSNIQNESSNYWHFGGNCSSCLGSEREIVWASADARRTGDSGYRVCQITCCNTATQENLLENFDKFFLCAIVKIYLDLFFISLKQPNTLLKRTHRPAGAKWHQCRDQKRLISFSAFNIQHVDVKMSTSHKWGITQS